MIEKKEAQKILNIYRFMRQDGTLYLGEDEEVLDTLFSTIIEAITDSGQLKTKLPYN